jgi:undecaprenyl-diphosphatase
VLFFSLAFGITLVSRPLGGLMFAHAAIIDSLPRMYLGFHYPTDVIAGACIGMVGTWYLMKVAAVQRQSERLVQWSAREPGLFHAGLAVLTLQLATMFDGAIKLTKITLYLGRSAYRHFL